MNKTIAAYLDDKKDKIRSLYTWDFDPSIPQEKFGIKVEGTNWLDKTISLKCNLRTHIQHNPRSKKDVAEYFIKEWGGIKRFSKAEEVVKVFSNIENSKEIPKTFKPRFMSVSSWSKWASLICPNWACIYDARVAYSINVINYLNGGTHRIFPAPDGRNSRLRLLDVSTLLLEMKIRNGDSSGPKDVEAAHFVKKNDAYLEYLKLISSVSEILWKDRARIHEVEMLLFALADTNIYDDLFTKIGTVDARS